MWSSAPSERLVIPFILLTVTGSYIVVVLQTMFMLQQHTGENIAETIQAVLEAWDLQEIHQVCLTRQWQ